MKDRNKKIMVVALVIITVVSIGVIINWATNAEAEASLYVISNDGNTVFTFVGDDECEKHLIIYYDKCEGGADNEFIFYITDDEAPAPSFKVYTSDLNILAGSDDVHSNGEVIRLPYIDWIEAMPISVSINNEIEEYFEETIFILRWRNIEGGHDGHQPFLIRYYNIDKVTSLNWGVPDGFNLTLNNDWIEDNYVDATTNHSGWYMLKGRIDNDMKPWRSTNVDLWFNPDQNETHMVPSCVIEII
jgi:hypothetical protein